jgi:hypothetical protein
MPGIPTHFLLLDRTNDRLDIADKNLGYGYLGAIGASLGDFIPHTDSGSGAPDRTVYWQVWNQIFALLFGYNPDKPTDNSAQPPLIDLLRTIESTLEKLKAAVGPRDLGKLQDLSDSGQLDQFQAAAADLAKFVTLLNLDPGELTAPIGQLIYNSTNFKPGSGNRPPEKLFMRDLLHARRTGTFLRLLLEGANDAGDEKLGAYSLGYLTSYAGKVCGNPFINSIVRGSYRTQWWRHRWISNYVDAWVYGFYDAGATMAGDTPTPPYADWRNLADAKLHLKLSEGLGQNSPMAGLDVAFVMDVLRGKQELPTDKMLPPVFCEYWCKAVADAYGDLAPEWITDADKDRRRLILSHAFLQLWMVLWFQTGSGVQGLGLLPPLPDKKPSGCTGSQPKWDGPGTHGQDSGNPATVPPVPRPETESDAARTITGIFAIVLGALAFLASEGLLGGGMIGAGVALVLDDDTTANWDALDCSLYWYRWYHYGFCEALHQSLVYGGFSFPYAAELDKTLMDAEGKDISVGIDRIKSQRTDTFPAKQPTTVPQMTAWLIPPSTGQEQLPTIGYLDAAYPNFFIDDPSHNLGPGKFRSVHETPGLVNDANLFKTEMQLASRTGNAILNIQELLAHRDDFVGPDNDFPQWNLDADRGLYFWTWTFRDPKVYDTTQITIAD